MNTRTLTNRITTQEQEVDRLVAIRTQQGTIGRPDYDESLTRLGKEPTNGTRGHLRRLVSRVQPADPPPSASFIIDEEALIAPAKSPTIEQFHKDCDADPDLALTVASS